MNMKQWIRRKLHYYRFYYNIKHKKWKESETSVNDLIVCNMFGGELFRVDIIVRYLAIESIYGKNTYGTDLYKKMQSKKVRPGYAEESLEIFKKLIDSFDKNGYDMNSRILVDREYNLVDGSHRLALSLYYDVPTVAIAILDNKEKFDYSINWFIDNGFSDEEIKLIKEKERELTQKFGWIRNGGE